MNDSISMNEEDEENWRQNYISDSIYFENMIIDSQKEQKNE